MEKVINIDGKQIKFKSNAATPLRYKAQFNKDFFSEILKLENTGKNKKDNPLEIDMEVLYNISWILAKTADPSIPGPIEWLERFEVFPIGEVIPQLQELIISSLGTKKK